MLFIACAMYIVTTGGAGKAGKSAIFKNWTEKPGKLAPISDREAGKAGISGKKYNFKFHGWEKI